MSDDPEYKGDGHGPIENKHRRQMNELARFLDHAFNGHVKGGQREYGFFLAVYRLGEGPGRFNYISNSQRVDVHALLSEMLIKFKNQQEAGDDPSKKVN